MVKLEKSLPKEIELILTVHDSFLFQVDERVKYELAVEKIRKILEVDIKDYVKLEVDFSQKSKKYKK